jgi:hypothetical protein
VTCMRPECCMDFTNGMSVHEAGRLGSFASAKIVSRLGPRLDVRLGEHIATIMDGADPAKEMLE